MKINIKFFLLLIAASLVSCEEDGYADFDAGETNTQPFHGEWYIASYDADGEVISDYHHWYTYNTAQNNDSIWIDDYDSDYGIKTKVLTNLSNMTFSSSPNASSEYLDETTVTILNGRIFENQGLASSSRTVVDSIYFEVEFSDEPGVIYKFGGHERTGFDEDDNPHL